MMSRLRITEQFATPHHCNIATPRHAHCTPPWLHLIHCYARTSCIGACNHLPFYPHIFIPAPSEVALRHHDSRLVAGSSAPDIAHTCHPHYLARLIALPPCTMHCVARSSIPPPMPFAACSAVRLPYLLHVAEPAEGEGPQGDARGNQRGRV
jgi:hypothetical protein